MKKILLIISLFLPMFVTETSARTLVAGTGIDNTTCGTDCSWAYYDDGTLEFTGTGGNATIDGYDEYYKSGSGYTSRAPWGDVIKTATNINVSNIVSIGKNAFTRAYNATSITLPEGLTTIGANSFTFFASNSSATNSIEIVIPSTVTDLGAGFSYSFNWNSNLGRRYIDKIYCSVENQDMCKEATGNKNLVATYQYENGKYVLNGKTYSSLQNMQRGKEMKRIYTIDEATKLSKPTGNTFKIRYK